MICKVKYHNQRNLKSSDGIGATTAKEDIMIITSIKGIHNKSI